MRLAYVTFMAPSPGYYFQGARGWYVTEPRGDAVIAGPFRSERLAYEWAARNSFET